MTRKTPITIARGDGIGPEIMDATLRILEAAGARIAPEEIEIGKAVYDRGVKTGIEDSSWDSLRRTKVFLKSPITTPQGGGFKSLNVTVRKSLGLYANVRPCVSYHPYVKTNHPKMDLVIVRENEEDLYAGIEYRPTQETYESVKLISRAGCERIARYAFEYARANGRKKVTCMSKDNIMKMADGLFHRVYDEIGAEYPEIAKEHYIVDIGAARIACRPQDFDVIVTENLYGDIISDIAAEVTGSVGLGGSSNIGTQCAMFEAIHGSAPDIAGKGIANPSGLLLGAVMMLVHIGQGDVAEKIHNAWFKTIEDGIHTGDLFREGLSARKVGTSDFAAAVVERLGAKPEKFKPVSYATSGKGVMALPPLKSVPAEKKILSGVDVTVEWKGAAPEAIAAKVKTCTLDGLSLQNITNRGVVVWPDGQPETSCSDQWRLRLTGSGNVSFGHIVDVLGKLDAAGLDIAKAANLYTYDGKPGWSAGQGE